MEVLYKMLLPLLKPLSLTKIYLLQPKALKIKTKKIEARVFAFLIPAKDHRQLVATADLLKYIYKSTMDHVRRPTVEADG